MAKNQKKKGKKNYSGQQQKEIDCDEPHSTLNEKMQPIQWTERPTSALVAVNSLWLTIELHPDPFYLENEASSINVENSILLYVYLSKCAFTGRQFLCQTR